MAPGGKNYLLSDEIIDLIFEKRFDDAKLLIDSENDRLPIGESHRLVALSAVLNNERGDIDKSIVLMRLAIQEKPNWLPHLYRLSVILMDAEYWNDADIVLNELIALSLAKSDAYFLGDARLRKALCLSMLRREVELKRCRQESGWNCRSAASENLNITCQAARSIG